MEIQTLNELGVVLHELFLSYVAAGFTEDQALRLLGAWMANSQRPPEGSE